MNKRNTIINAEIVGGMASLFHGDTMVICDSGFPVPKGERYVDLSLTAGKPPFWEVLNAVLAEFVAESYAILDYTKQYNKELYDALEQKLPNQERTELSMDEFVEWAKKAKLIIRTGEIKPCSNIILQSASCIQQFVDQYNVD